MDTEDVIMWLFQFLFALPFLMSVAFVARGLATPPYGPVWRCGLVSPVCRYRLVSLPDDTLALAVEY
jgi:hypothetical protein